MRYIQFITGCIFISILLMISFSSAGEKDLEKLREIMIKKQIVARGIKDKRVLDAMQSVERHKFVIDKSIYEAYEDHPLPIGYGQTISQPYIVALMTELCELDGSEKVLEIGTGSGYQAAILSKLAAEVYSIEIIKELGKSAEKRLTELGYKNVNVRIGDGYKGWPEQAPFDVIMLTACPVDVPPALISQLKDNGLIIAPVGDYHQELIRIRKIGSELQRELITYVRFVPMVHDQKK